MSVQVPATVPLKTLALSASETRKPPLACQKAQLASALTISLPESRNVARPDVLKNKLLTFKAALSISAPARRFKVNTALILRNEMAPDASTSRLLLPPVSVEPKLTLSAFKEI